MKNENAPRAGDMAVILRSDAPGQRGEKVRVLSDPERIGCQDRFGTRHFGQFSEIDIPDFDGRPTTWLYTAWLVRIPGDGEAEGLFGELALEIAA